MLYAGQVRALIDEDKQLSQLAILTQALPVLTDYLKATETRHKVQLSAAITAITAKIDSAEERLATAYQSSV
jgi:hypothetical protein